MRFSKPPKSEFLEFALNLELYDRSLLRKGGLTLSRSIEILRPYEKQLIQALRELEEKRQANERINPALEALGAPSGINPCTGSKTHRAGL